MGCCHYFAQEEGGDGAFSVDASTIVFGRGVLGEAGDHAYGLGLKRVAVFTDERLAALEHLDVLACRRCDRPA